MSDNPFQIPPRPQLKPFRVIARAGGMLQRDARLVLPLLLIWTAALTAVIAGLSQLTGADLSLTRLPAALLMEPFFLGALVYAAVGDYTPRLGEALDVGSQAYFTMLPAVVALNVMVLVGFMTLFFPGVAALAFFALVYSIILAERPGVRAAFAFSFARVMGNFWPVVAVIALVMLPGLIVLQIGMAVLTTNSAPGSLGQFAAVALREALAGIAWAYIGASLYFELTGDKDLNA